MELPRHYDVCKHILYKSRWVVTYKNDPELLMVPNNMHGDKIRTFKTRRAAEQAAIDHAAEVKRLNDQARAFNGR